MAAFDLRTGQISDGYLPKRAEAMVKEWVDKNREDLLIMWDTQEFRKLDTLE